MASSVPLLGDQFVAGPFALAEGERTFALVARDAAGNEVSRAHHVVRDVTAPTVSIQQPAASALVGANAVQVTGQVADPHLASVVVNGVAAALSGSGVRTWVAPAGAARRRGDDADRDCGRPRRQSRPR